MKKIILSSAILAASFLTAQNTGIGTTKPDPSAKLEISSTNQGVLFPRVALTATTSASPIASPALGLTVFNTATAGDVAPGYYYWDNAKWVKLTGNAWSPSGNIGTAPGTNFIGTADNVDVVFKRNSTPSGRLNATNTSFGQGSMKSFDYTPSKSLGYNTAMGNDALLSLTTGAGNTAVGFASLRNITTDINNTAVGVMSLMNLYSGTRNVALGNGVGNSATQGSYNVLIGDGVNKPFRAAGDYQLNIGNWIFGDNGKIGIGPAYKGSYAGLDNLTPGRTMTEQLEVDGSAKLLKINTAPYVAAPADKTVAADANGVLKLKPAVPANISGSIDMANASFNTNVDASSYMPILLKFVPQSAGLNSGYYFSVDSNNKWVLNLTVGEGFSGSSTTVNYEIAFLNK